MFVFLDLAAWPDTVEAFKTFVPQNSVAGCSVPFPSWLWARGVRIITPTSQIRKSGLEEICDLQGPGAELWLGPESSDHKLRILTSVPTLEGGSKRAVSVESTWSESIMQMFVHLLRVGQRTVACSLGTGQSAAPVPPADVPSFRTGLEPSRGGTQGPRCRGWSRTQKRQWKRPLPRW